MCVCMATPTQRLSCSLTADSHGSVPHALTQENKLQSRLDDWRDLRHVTTVKLKTDFFSKPHAAPSIADCRGLQSRCTDVPDQTSEARRQSAYLLHTIEHQVMAACCSHREAEKRLHTQPQQTNQTTPLQTNAKKLRCGFFSQSTPTSKELRKARKTPAGCPPPRKCPVTGVPVGVACRQAPPSDTSEHDGTRREGGPCTHRPRQHSHHHGHEPPTSIHWGPPPRLASDCDATVALFVELVKKAH